MANPPKEFTGACNHCDWMSVWSTPAHAWAAAEWHVYDFHRPEWDDAVRWRNFGMGDRYVLYREDTRPLTPRPPVRYI